MALVAVNAATTTDLRGGRFCSFLLARLYSSALLSLSAGLHANGEPIAVAAALRQLISVEKLAPRDASRI
jgi:hypothetical protein